VLFFPDEHLGRNTALKMGISPDEIVVWNQHLDGGGVEDINTLVSARVILWKGWCSTHQRFTVEQIAKARAEYPGIRVVVHPECPHDVVAAADENGSTEYIIRVVEDSPAGTTWAIGTEINLVRRLAKNNPDKTIFCLDPVVCPCSTMYRIHPAYLAWTLEQLEQGNVINQVSVDEETAHWARVALERMLAIIASVPAIRAVGTLRPARMARAKANWHISAVECHQFALVDVQPGSHSSR